MNKTLRNVLIGVGVLVVIAIVANKMGWIGKPKAVKVAVTKAENKNIIETVSASGKIQPEIEVKLSPEVSGEIVELTVKEGDIVMVDGGTSCEGYASDITRTFVLGKASQRQTDVWNLEKKAQDAAFAAVKIGAPCEQVDAAARAVIENGGFSRQYKLPGLPHRTGHGIGLEGHEWTNFVKGNKTPIAVGMCFSDEPTISIPGEFGIRLEDCLYISEEGPRFFSKQSISIDKPFG